MRGPRFVDNGSIITAGGLTSGISAALHVISRYYDAQTASKTAAYLEFVPTQRPAVGSRRSVHYRPRRGNHAPMKLLVTLLCATLLAAAPPPPGANLTLASSLIASGGGPGGHLDRARVHDDRRRRRADEHQLATAYGQTNADRFVHMFDYAIADAWQLAGKNNLSIPPPAQTGGQALRRNSCKPALSVAALRSIPTRSSRRSLVRRSAGRSRGGRQRQVRLRFVDQLQPHVGPVLPQYRSDGRDERLSALLRANVEDVLRDHRRRR